MPRTRVIGPVIGGVGTLLALALVFGNQWFVDFTVRHEYYANPKYGPLLQALIFPGWRVSPPRGQALVPEDMSTLALFGLAAGLIAVAVGSLDPRRRGFAVVAAGWWATVVAAAVAGLLRGLLFVAFESDLPGDMPWQITWSDLGGGLRFGLFFGWLTGLVVLVALGRSAAGALAGPAGPYPNAPMPPYAQPGPGPSAPPPPWGPPHPGAASPPPGAVPAPYPPPPGGAVRPAPYEDRTPRRPAEPPWPPGPPDPVEPAPAGGDSADQATREQSVWEPPRRERRWADAWDEETRRDPGRTDTSSSGDAAD